MHGSKSGAGRCARKRRPPPGRRLAEGPWGTRWREDRREQERRAVSFHSTPSALASAAAGKQSLQEQWPRPALCSWHEKQVTGQPVSAPINVTLITLLDSTLHISTDGIHLNLRPSKTWQITWASPQFYTRTASDGKGLPSSLRITAPGRGRSSSTPPSSPSCHADPPHTWGPALGPSRSWSWEGCPLAGPAAGKGGPQAQEVSIQAKDRQEARYSASRSFR